MAIGRLDRLLVLVHATLMDFVNVALDALVSSQRQVRKIDLALALTLLVFLFRRRLEDSETRSEPRAMRASLQLFASDVEKNSI
jgi:hypothetical protein